MQKWPWILIVPVALLPACGPLPEDPAAAAEGAVPNESALPPIPDGTLDASALAGSRLPTTLPEGLDDWEMPTGPAPPPGGDPWTPGNGLPTEGFGRGGFPAPASAPSLSTEWRRSASEALEEARSIGKPLLFFFTHSVASPRGQDLENEVFNDPDFARGVAHRVVPVKIDFADGTTRKSEYYETLQESLGVRAFPTTVVVSPDGQAPRRKSGYSKSRSESYRTELLAAVRGVEAELARRRDLLDDYGYRRWTSRQGKTLFAKPVELAGGQVIVVDQWGKRMTLGQENLSEADREWVMAWVMRKE
ncbi:MAG: DUF255 domain-containing protein [Verrucomicrobiota bacterium]